MFIRSFFEQMYFFPKWYHYFVMVLLSPFSLLYGLIMLLRRMVASKKIFTLPIVSVGNLLVGGSGKTPFVIALASRYKGVTVISRGYGRQSSGLIEVSRYGKILVNVMQSGDEAMLMATSLPNASVIVSEDRTLAIEVAMRAGVKIIVMDDGFNRVEIKKFEILLEPQKIPNILPFPAGGLREFYFVKSFSDMVVKEGREFERQVTIENPTKNMLLVTAISNPERLTPFLPKEGVVNKVYYEDHAYFDEIVLLQLMTKYKATSILCTSKDRVKMQDFKLPISEMKLKLEIKNEIFTQIDKYIEGYRNEK